MEFFSLSLFFGKLKAEYIFKVPVFCFPHSNSMSWVRGRERVTGPKSPICFSYLREARSHNLLLSSLAPYSLHQTGSLIITSLPREQNNYFKVKDVKVFGQCWYVLYGKNKTGKMNLIIPNEEKIYSCSGEGRIWKGKIRTLCWSPKHIKK